MDGYSVRDVCRLLELPVALVRDYTRRGLLVPARGPRGEHRFGFRDLVLLRTAKELLRAKVPPRRVVRALKALQEQLPDRPLTGVRIVAEGRAVVVHEGDSAWVADTGQTVLRFDAALPPLAPPAPPARAPARAEEWFQLGCALEPDDTPRAREAYSRAVALSPEHAPARLNLGRLEHEAGALAAAEGHYRAALHAAPGDAIAWFNLGVVLEDLERPREADDAYRRALALDHALPDAHYNLARLCEQSGDRAAALRHLRAYRDLLHGS